LDRDKHEPIVIDKPYPEAIASKEEIITTSHAYKSTAGSDHPDSTSLQKHCVDDKYKDAHKAPKTEPAKAPVMVRKGSSGGVHRKSSSSSTEEIYDEVPVQVETDKTKEAILVGATTKTKTMKMTSSSSASSSDNEKANKKHKTSKTKPIVVEEKKVKKVSSSDEEKKKRKVSKKKDEAPALPKVAVEEMLSQVVLDGPGIGVIRVDKPVHFYIKPKLIPMNLVSVNVLCKLCILNKCQ
jgi:hypothetical protein